MSNGKLYLVATPIGNLDDISFRAIKTLQSSDLIIAEDTRHSLPLLKHFDINRTLESYHKFNESTKSEQILEKIKNGLNISLISDAGTPGISDPGNILVQRCIEENIDIVPIPGACAFIQALITSGFKTDNFCFYGFLPVKSKERKTMLESMKNNPIDILIIYEAPHKLLNTLEDISTTFGNIEVCISKEITKLYETHLRMKSKDAIQYFTENTPKGEFVLVLKKDTIVNINDISDSKVQKEILSYYSHEKSTASLKDISKALALKLGISKSIIYNFLLDNK